MKTERFYIKFASCGNDMSTQFEVSKTEWYRQIGYLESQIEATKDYEYPVEELQMTQPILEDERTATYERVFTSGAGDTILTRVVCKPGYQFKAKK